MHNWVLKYLKSVVFLFKLNEEKSAFKKYGLERRVYNKMFAGKDFWLLIGDGKYFKKRRFLTKKETKKE